MKSNYRNIFKIVIICCSLTNYEADDAFLYTEWFLLLSWVELLRTHHSYSGGNYIRYENNHSVNNICFHYSSST